MPQYRGPYPYLAGTDQVRNTPAYTDELAQLLAVPAPRSKELGNTALSANVSTYTPVPGLATAYFTLGQPTLCLVNLRVSVSGTVNAFHYLKLLVRHGDGTTEESPGNGGMILWKVASGQPDSLLWPVVIKSGSNQVRAEAIYKTPASTTASLQYPRLDLIPIRAALP